MVNKLYLGIAGILLIVGAFFIFSGGGVSASYATLESFDQEILIYKSSSCGCCGVYGDYFKRRGNADAEIVSVNDVNSIKDEYGVPYGLESCHTTIIGDYFVEGHIPLEAVEKLLNEKPDIAGIAMPGMPAGSPGMPGSKYGEFVIYAVNHDGSYEEFMRI